MKKILFIFFAFVAILSGCDFLEDNSMTKDKLEANRWVDLGLPSGILWAAYNVGATSPDECGGYYAWGETEEKSSYTEDNYKHSTFIGYNEFDEPLYEYHYIGEDISGTEYDVAHVKWGDGAKIPTLDNAFELINFCTWKDGKLNGISGVFVYGPNGNYIFIPKCGYKYKRLYDSGTSAYYQISTYCKDGSPDDSYVLYYYYEGDNEFDLYCTGDEDRSSGYSVRPVKDPEEHNN